MFQKVKDFLFKNQSVRQTVAKNTFWITVSQFTGRLLRAAVVIYAARILGTTNWGVFSYALSLSAFLSIFSDIGITGLITREASRSPELRGNYLSTGFIIKLFLLAVESVIFLAIAPFIVHESAVLALLPIVVLLTIIDGLRDLSSSIARSSERLEIEAATNIITNIAILILGFVFLSIQPTGEMLANAYVVGSGVGLLVIIIALKSYFTGMLKNFSPTLVKSIFLHAWPFGLMGLMGALMINTDTIIIGLMRTIGEVGLYSAAQRPIVLLYILPGLLAVPLFPFMSRVSIGVDMERLKSVLKKALRLVIIAALPLAAGGIFLGNEIIFLLYGPEYALAASSFQVLSLTLLTTFPAIIVGNALFALNKQREVIIYTAISVVANLILDIYLIKKYGIVGSAIATLFVQIIANAYAFLQIKNLIHPSFFLELAKPAIAVVVMTVVLFAIQLITRSLPVVILGGGVAYLSTLFLLKEPSLVEIRAVFR